MAEPTTINWPKTLSFTEVLPPRLWLYKHKLAASAGFKAWFGQECGVSVLNVPIMLAPIRNITCGQRDHMLIYVHAQGRNTR